MANKKQNALIRRMNRKMGAEIEREFDADTLIDVVQDIARHFNIPISRQEIVEGMAKTIPLGTKGIITVKFSVFSEDISRLFIKLDKTGEFLRNLTLEDASMP